MSRALVVSGGGSKGAFAVGVLKTILNRFPKLQFDILVGTSTGALIVPLVAIKEYTLLEKLYTTIRTSDVILKGNLGDRLSEHSLYDANPLWKLLVNVISDERYKNIKASGRKVLINCTCLQTRRLTVFTTNPYTSIPQSYDVTLLTGVDHFRKAMMASACQPVFMPPVKVNLKVPGALNPNYQFVDGGLREYAGVQMAIDSGATEIFTILLSAEQEDISNTQFESLIPILERTIDIFTLDIGNNDLVVPDQFNRALQYLEAVKQKIVISGISRTQVDTWFATPGKENPFQNKRPVSIFIIRPLAPLGGGPGGLNFDPTEMMAMLNAGELTAGKFIAALKPGDVTWA